MNFSADMQQIINQVEQVTGKPVYLKLDSKLPTSAAAKIAQSDSLAHLLTYKSETLTTEYAIASQLSAILRVYATPLESRAELAVTAEGRKAVREMLVGPHGTLKPYNLPESVVETATNQMFDGLMTQLRSLPIEMRVAVSLREAYSSLWNRQELFLGSEQAQAVQCLAPQIRAMTPPTVFAANASMNATYALFCDRLLGRSLYAVAYRSTGLSERGQALLDMFDETSSAPPHDRSLIDLWAHDLGLADWYLWKPWK